jgi:hypothetical protein
VACDRDIYEKRLKIYGLVVEQRTWRIRTNQELWKLYKGLDVVGDIKKKRLE